MRRYLLLGALLLSNVNCGGDDIASKGYQAVGGAGGVDGMGGSGGNGDIPVMGGAGSGVPLDGLGTINGMCGELDPVELVAGSPGFLVSNEIDFGSMAFDATKLSEGGLKLYNDPNLGGSSKFSEVFAYEVLYRCELAKLLKSEAEIIYDVEGKKTDMLVEIDGQQIGVSVVRAYKPGGEYTIEDAKIILTKKLSDILASTDNVSPGDAWPKQILHVIAYQPKHRDAIMDGFSLIDPMVRADTIVVVSLTSGSDEFIYTE